MIAVDPGPLESAVLQYDGSRVTNPRILPNADLRLWLLHQAPHDTLAVEMLACMGMAVGREVFETCLFVGRLQEIWLGLNRPLQLVYRNQVKMHLCGSMRARDCNIRTALLDKFGGKDLALGRKNAPGPIYGVTKHLWAALGVAVYAHETNPP